jgi:hypothetical protein
MKRFYKDLDDKQKIKRQNMNKKLLVLVCAGLVCTSYASAEVLFNFATSTSQGDFGLTPSFFDTTGTYSIGAKAWTTQNASPQGVQTIGYVWDPGTLTARKLFGKYTSSLDNVETGLGLEDIGGIDTDNEILPKSFVQLDLNNVQDANLKEMRVVISSMTGQEGVYIWGSNTAQSPGQLLAQGHAGTSAPSGVQTFTVNTSAFRYLSVSSEYNGLADTSANILLRNGFVAAAVPEPSSMLMISPVMVIGFWIRRRFMY